MPEQSSADDQLAIQRTLHDYAWACDNGDWALLSTLFTLPTPTGGYYQLRFARSADGWKIGRLYEDNRWMTPVS